MPNRSECDPGGFTLKSRPASQLLQSCIIIGLTPQTQNVMSRPIFGAKRYATESGAPKIELGQEAIAAGLKVLLESGALYYETESHRPLVEDILKASLRNAGYSLQILKDRRPTV